MGRQATCGRVTAFFIRPDMPHALIQSRGSLLLCAAALLAGGFGAGWALRPAPAVAPIGPPDTVALQAPLPSPAQALRQASRAGSDGAAGSVDAAGAPAPLRSAQIQDLGARLKAEADPLLRRQLFQQMIAGLTAENALEIRAQIAQLPHDGLEFRDFHFAWGKIAGSDAVLHGVDTPERDMEATLAGWASASPQAALAWFQQLEKEGKKGDNQQFLKGAMVHGLAVTDPARAAQFLIGLSEAGDKQAAGLMPIVAGRMVQQQGLEAAVRWTESLPEGPLRASAALRLAGDYVNADPARAAAWAASLQDRPDYAKVVARVSQLWAGRDVDAAVRWTESLPPSPAKHEGLSAAYGQWGARDPETASRTLYHMPPSTEKNFAINGFISGLAHSDPEAAVIWAAEISEPKMREAALVRAGRQYYRQQPQAAMQWLASSGLPETAWQQVTSGRR